MFKSVILFCVILAVVNSEYLQGGYGGDYGLYGGYGYGGYGGHGLHGYGYGYATPLATSYSSRVDYPSHHVPVVKSYVAPIISKPVVVAPLAYGLTSGYGYGHGVYGGGLEHGAYGGYGYGQPYIGSDYGYGGHHEYKK